MKKPSPNPPNTDPNSAFDSPSTADIKATPRTPGTLFCVNPETRTEDLMAYLVETLASIDVMVHQLVDHLDGSDRNALLGISNSVMLAEITANRVLDQIAPVE
ncbi:hypothetical protein DKY63_00735 [Pseudomonas putida]|uniref:DUF3077 domain-containing protein n=1 Tax=Pseudomonas putida TaxID=303 RepID=A0A2Z4RBM0_PSEPU|nr:DUF6124 family protein [Pseudomonas putida]AWY38503.1 hypothetical protein DKY63_00735 [Pseudomonas putida]